MAKKYFVSDSPAHDLHIWLEETDEDSDGEFIFDTLKSAKKYCLSRIDYDIKQLERNRVLINEED